MNYGKETLYDLNLILCLQPALLPYLSTIKKWKVSICNHSEWTGSVLVLDTSLFNQMSNLSELSVELGFLVNLKLLFHLRRRILLCWSQCWSSSMELLRNLEWSGNSVLIWEPVKIKKFWYCLLEMGKFKVSHTWQLKY